MNLNEMQDILNRSNRMPDAAKAFDKMLNSGGIEEQRLFVAEMVMREHNTLQQTMMRCVIWPIIQGMAELEVDGLYDLRNEGTVKLCRRIVDAIGDDHPMPFI